MQLEDYFDFQAPDDIRLKGRRIGIETILYEYIHQERRPEQIARRYELSLEEAYATILYYLHNQESVGKYLADWMEYCRKSHEESRRNNPELYEKLRKLAAEQRSRKRVKR